MEEGDSLDTLKDSTVSGMDSDLMEDTMASQQTVSTEISLPGRSAASVVIANAI